ncbi:siderophore-interacting protein [Streptomyces sp. XM4011]|uniref:siderophore-interacting protein n=1 Tax=Streptomyces sp. XM4011 TaxID=2929780 RepID=UPI001FFAEE84|nr:siderophore-interacting protein [Streptomyces sp. XM4011]MCK1815010.1 siderophore-interacting protein [Streptomyces sp. XM4011]
MGNIVTHRGRVLRTERLSAHLIRVVFGGEGLREFAVGPYSDSYVKLVFRQPGVEYPEPFDVAEIRQTLPRDQWPATRTYTVRAFDPAGPEMTIDFVYHGDSGLAGPWAAAAQPGDELAILGPGGAYAPDPGADWHLLVGDESALPAIAASVEQLPEGAVARVFVEIAGPGEELKLTPPAGDVEVVWVDRREGRYGRALVEAVTSLELPPGRGQAFVHGEANWVKELRRHLRQERGMTPAQLSISGYWRYGSNEDGWQAAKAEFNRRVMQEQEGEQPGSA